MLWVRIIHIIVVVIKTPRLIRIQIVRLVFIHIGRKHKFINRDGDLFDYCTHNYTYNIQHTSITSARLPAVAILYKIMYNNFFFFYNFSLDITINRHATTIAILNKTQKKKKWFFFYWFFKYVLSFFTYKLFFKLYRFYNESI